MSTVSFTGTSLQSLQNTVLEYTNPGDVVEVLLGIERDLSVDELSMLRQGITRNGLDVKSLQIGTGPWENTLRLKFVRPSVKGYGQVQLIIPIAVGLGILGLTGILGWQIGTVIGQIGKYIIPLALIAATTFIVYTISKK